MSLHAFLRCRGRAVCGSCTCHHQVLWSFHCKAVGNTALKIDSKYAQPPRKVQVGNQSTASGCFYTLVTEWFWRDFKETSLEQEAAALGSSFDEGAVPSAPGASFPGLLNRHMSAAIISQALFLSLVLMCCYFMSHQVRGESGDMKPFLPFLKSDWWPQLNSIPRKRHLIESGQSFPWDAE